MIDMTLRMFVHAVCVPLVFLSPSAGLAQEGGDSPIPASSRQMILVLSESFDASAGVLQRFERESDGADWTAVGRGTPIALGRNGLGLGIGLHEIEPGAMPVKREGDGKSPAGVFLLSSAFGYAPAADLEELEIPYTHVTDKLECVDDVNSAHYNQIVMRDGVDEVRRLVLPFTPEAVEHATWISPEVTRRIARELAAAPTAAVYGRIGTNTVRFGTLASWLTDVVTTLTGNLDQPGGMMWAHPAHLGLLKVCRSRVFS